MIPATMGDLPLTVNAILRHGRTVHGEAECVTCTGEGSRRATYAEVAANADRLAAALTRLGIGEDDRVGEAGERLSGRHQPQHQAGCEH